MYEHVAPGPALLNIPEVVLEEPRNLFALHVVQRVADVRDLARVLDVVHPVGCRDYCGQEPDTSEDARLPDEVQVKGRVDIAEVDRPEAGSRVYDLV